MNCHSDDYQNAYARAWRELCRSEGHMPGLPKNERSGGAIPSDEFAAIKLQARRLRAAGWTQQEIADAIGKSRTVVENALRGWSPPVKAVEPARAPASITRVKVRAAVPSDSTGEGTWAFVSLRAAPGEQPDG